MQVNLKSFQSILLTAVAGLALCVACRTMLEQPAAGDRALDVILLSEESPDAGPLLFAHRRHYAPASEGGTGIPCATCHHDYDPASDAPPQACRTCHAGHHEEAELAAKTPL